MYNSRQYPFDYSRRRGLSFEAQGLVAHLPMTLEALGTSFYGETKLYKRGIHLQQDMFDDLSEPISSSGMY